MSTFYGWHIWPHVNNQGIAATSVKIVHLDAHRNEASYSMAISVQVNQVKGVTQIKDSIMLRSLSRNLQNCYRDSPVARRS